MTAVNSRDPKLLAPDVYPKYLHFEKRCKEEGIDFVVTCTYRNDEAQTELYAQGRTKPGRIVTNAKAGQSLHNAVGGDGQPAARAFDIVVMRHGKPIWGTSGDGIDDDPSDDDRDDLELWQRAGLIGEECGFEWAGRWKSFREFPHFQLRS